MVCPSSMPAGMSTLTVRLRRTMPLPLQVGQGWAMVLPLPPHSGQVVWDCMVPKGVREVCTTVPLPWQREQVSAVVPSAQPLPWQSLHSSTFCTLSSRVQPKAASSKETVTLLRTLEPCWGPFRRPPPPPPKMSPKPPPKPPPNRSLRISAKPPKSALLLWKPEGSKAAKPYWSYFARLSGSESTS